MSKNQFFATYRDIRDEFGEFKNEFFALHNSLDSAIQLWNSVDDSQRSRFWLYRTSEVKVNETYLKNPLTKDDIKILEVKIKKNKVAR